MTSSDVWHTFGVPDLQLKADATPGEYDGIQFRTDALERGTERESLVECFELCGESHSSMTAEMRVVPESAFDDWLEQRSRDDS